MRKSKKIAKVERKSMKSGKKRLKKDSSEKQESYIHRMELANKNKSRKSFKNQFKMMDKKTMKVVFFVSSISFLASVFVYLFYKNLIGSIFVFASVPFAFILYHILSLRLKVASKIRKVEDVFPDFLQLMSSNLRAGMTIDRALLMSSRPEFDPLDREILSVGKDIATGKSIESALLEFGERVGSKKIEKTIQLILSGIRSGGNLAVLLEETSRNMRERGFVEKKAASNVLMYVIFIFIAASVGAPALFSLSSILVETLVSLLAGMPQVDTSANLPFTLSTLSISPAFIYWFSLVFIVVINFLASLVLGLVNKGEEREGLRYLPVMLILSILIFLGIRLILSGVVAGFF